MSLVIFWLVCALMGAWMLSSHNKAGLGCAAGGCLGPLGILLAWFEKSSLDRQADLRREEIRSAELRALASTAARSLPPPIASRPERDCPFCAERILVEAKICKHCGREVPVMREGEPPRSR